MIKPLSVWGSDFYVCGGRGSDRNHWKSALFRYTFWWF